MIRCAFGLGYPADRMEMQCAQRPPSRRAGLRRLGFSYEKGVFRQAAVVKGRQPRGDTAWYAMIDSEAAGPAGRLRPMARPGQFRCRGGELRLPERVRLSDLTAPILVGRWGRSAGGRGSDTGASWDGGGANRFPFGPPHDKDPEPDGERAPTPEAAARKGAASDAGSVFCGKSFASFPPGRPRYATLRARDLRPQPSKTFA